MLSSKCFYLCVTYCSVVSLYALQLLVMLLFITIGAFPTTKSLKQFIYYSLPSVKTCKFPLLIPFDLDLSTFLINFFVVLLLITFESVTTLSTASDVAIIEAASYLLLFRDSCSIYQIISHLSNGKNVHPFQFNRPTPSIMTFDDGSDRFLFKCRFSLGTFLCIEQKLIPLLIQVFA